MPGLSAKEMKRALAGQKSLGAGAPEVVLLGAGERLCPLSLTLEAGWTHDERLLEGVGPGADLGRSRLQGHAPLGDRSHGCR